MFSEREVAAVETCPCCGSTYQLDPDRFPTSRDAFECDHQDNIALIPKRDQ